MKLKLSARLKFNAYVSLDTAIYSPKNNSIICVAERQLIRTFDVETGIQIGKDMIGHEFRIFCLAYSLDERLIASGSSDKSIRIWDAKAQQQIHCLLGHVQNVNFLQFLSERLMSSDYGNNIIIWDLSNLGRIISKVTMKQILYQPQCSLDGKLIIFSDSDKINVWNTVKQSFSQRISSRIERRQPILSPNRRLIAITQRKKQIHFFDVRSGKMIRKLSAQHGWFINYIQFQLNGIKIVSNYSHNTIRICNVITAKQEFIAPIEDNQYVQYTSDNQLMIVNTIEAQIMIYKLKQ